MCVCGLKYLACNAHAPYCHLLPIRLYNIFPYYLVKNRIFFKKKRNAKCVLRSPLQLLSETFLVLRRTERDMIKNVYRSSCKVSVILDRFEQNLKSVDRFSENSQISNLMKIRQVVTELFHAYGRTDRNGEANSRF
jgi:hypothetical protein